MTAGKDVWRKLVKDPMPEVFPRLGEILAQHAQLYRLCIVNAGEIVNALDIPSHTHMQYEVARDLFNTTVRRYVEEGHRHGKHKHRA